MGHPRGVDEVAGHEIHRVHITPTPPPDPFPRRTAPCFRGTPKPSTGHHHHRRTRTLRLALGHWRWLGRATAHGDTDADTAKAYPMTTTQALPTLLLIALAAVAAPILAELSRRVVPVPEVVIQILLGILIGPSVLALTRTTSVVT